ncbi:MAG: FKBP-type peptidyl-prolyl cis-trans isomerase [Chitinophagales bacterium]
MKYLFLLMLIVSGSYFASAQNTDPNSKTSPVLKNALDSFSYAMGLSMGNLCNRQGIPEINTTLLLQGVNDGRTPTMALLNDQQINTIINNYISRQQTQQVSATKEEGRLFLEANAKKPGVVVRPSGLQYQVLVAGKDTTRPKLTDKVRCHYHGTLLNGTIFDSSVDRGQPTEFNLTQVIPGWTEALQLMTVGSKWKLFVPSQLAYGDRSRGPSIPGGSTLVFEVELIAIVK